MVIAKKVLFLIAGLFKVILGGLVFLVAALIVLLKGLLRTILNTDHSVADEMVKGMMDSSSEYAFLATYSYGEKVDYILGVTTRFGLVVGLIAAVWIALAVLLFIHCRRIHRDDMRTKQSIFFTVATWLTSPLAISTILITIATLLRRRKDSGRGMEIEAYQE